MTEAYISVPIPAYSSLVSVPVPQEGAVPYQGQAQAGASLVPIISITSTPSDIAKDSLLKLLALPKDNPVHQYDCVCTDFVDYLDKCEQKGFMIKGYDTVKGKILNLPMSYDNRWGPSRRRELSEKLKRLEFWFEMQEDRPVTMITLTSYQDGLTIPQAWFNLNKSRGKLLKMIKKYCGDVDYFWVPEPHKSGYVHYHVAVFADIPTELENKLRHLWSTKYKTGSHTYGLDFSQKKNKENKIQHLKNYLSKYLEKGFLLKEWSIGMFLFNTHLWDTEFRMYGASTRIRAMMNIKEEKNSDIVWLETRMQTQELTPEGEEVQIDKQIWDRNYIPDWIDEPLWYGNGRQIPWDLQKQVIEERKARGNCHYDWGRPTKDKYHGEYDVVRTPEEWRKYRKQQQDGYL
jgi:hypothetical protein